MYEIQFFFVQANHPENIFLKWKTSSQQILLKQQFLIILHSLNYLKAN